MDLNTRVVIILLILSLSLVALHRIGVMNTYYDLLDTQHHNYYGTSDDGTSNSSLSIYKDHIEMECYIANLNQHRFCELDIILTKNKELGLNLSRYKNIFIEIEYLTPETTELPVSTLPIRVYFRNYNTLYSKLNDLTSSKYNSVQFEPNIDLSNKKIPLDSLQVSTWWIEQNKVSFENAQVDISNVTSIEFSTAYLSAIGSYQIKLYKFQLQGELFSESNLLKALLIFWLLTAIFLVNRQRRILHHVSNIDSLTNILNRRGFNAWLEKYFINEKNRSTISMFYIDIDDFKKINDSYGHLIGDKLLVKFGQIIREEVDLYFEKYKSNTNTLSRLSGDEFALVFIKISDKQTIDIAENLLKRFTKEIFIDDVCLKINASIGIAKGDDLHTLSSIDLMEHADAAMYHSKKNGKNQFKIYGKDVSTKLIERKNISSALSEAVQLNQFTLLFMPIYSSDSLKIKGAEVLIRATSEKLKTVGPDQFIPIAEEYGLIKAIDTWVLENTFKVMSQYKKIIEKNNLLFCINISALELNNNIFPKQLETLLEQYDISPLNIELEITETSLIDVDKKSIKLLEELKSIGVTLALDDFGTGYTAFNQLLNYPVNCIKIDRTFISKISNNETSDTTMVDIILGIAHSYQLTVVAEGVETEFQYQYLKEKKCHLLQGYYFSKPIIWENLLNKL